MSLVSDLLLEGATHLRRAGIETSRLEARLLLGYALGVSQAEITAESANPNPQSMHRFEALVSRRLAHEPLAYILGQREFWSLPFVVGPGVLIPRPESETLVEEALRSFPERDAPLNVLDLGTGSGCLLLSFLHERPRAKGIGIDLSREALSFAVQNAHDLELSQRVALAEGRWTEGVTDTFDVAFANPPYIAVDELGVLAPEIGYEPDLALTGGADGFDAYRQLAPILAPCLKPGGEAFIEIGAGQEERARALFAAAGLETSRCGRDLSGVARCLVLRRASF